MFFGGDPFEHFAHSHGGGGGGGGRGGRRPAADVDTTRLYETMGVSDSDQFKVSLFCCCGMLWHGMAACWRLVPVTVPVAHIISFHPILFYSSILFFYCVSSILFNSTVSICRSKRRSTPRRLKRPTVNWPSSTIRTREGTNTNSRKSMRPMRF
jgi:hypothetical protein